MIISDSKLKGLIVVCLVITISPFFCSIVHHLIKDNIPIFADQCDDCMEIEIIEDHQKTGVYFVPSGTSLNQLLESAGTGKLSNNNLSLKSGMKIIIDSASGNQQIVVAKMPAADRLSVGLPIDINTATEEDLIMIKGIGQSTAQRILDLRNKLKRFDDINQLMQIKGIKEKKLAKIQKYLYVNKQK
jgi:competence ComEA-like helix-hairpin-helix protein